MKRREFLKITSTALVSVGLPLTLLNEKPSAIPKGFIREVQQYSIVDGEEPWRYDAVGINAAGEEVQFYVQMDNDPYPEARRDAARFVIGHQFKKDGFTAIRPGSGHTLKLRLPRSVTGGYV